MRAGLNILVSFVLDAFTSEMQQDAERQKLAAQERRALEGDNGASSIHRPFAIVHHRGSDGDLGSQGVRPASLQAWHAIWKARRNERLSYVVQRHRPGLAAVHVLQLAQPGAVSLHAMIIPDPPLYSDVMLRMRLSSFEARPFE